MEELFETLGSRLRELEEQRGEPRTFHVNLREDAVYQLSMEDEREQKQYIVGHFPDRKGEWSVTMWQDALPFDIDNPYPDLGGSYDSFREIQDAVSARQNSRVRQAIPGDPIIMWEHRPELIGIAYDFETDLKSVEEQQEHYQGDPDKLVAKPIGKIHVPTLGQDEIVSVVEYPPPEMEEPRTADLGEPNVVRLH